jgi:tetratricopeptide (TPR) repeat protein
MSGRHYTDAELLAYAELNEECAELDAIRLHLRSCRRCSTALEEVRQFERLLADRGVHEHAAEPYPPPRRRSLLSVVDEALGGVRDNGRTLAELRQIPVDRWHAFLREHSEANTKAVCHEIVEEARRTFHHAPETALLMLSAAAAVANSLPDQLSAAEERGNIAKERANVFRALYRFPEAHEFLDEAERHLSVLPAPAFDLNFVHWSRATLFFFVGRYADAARIARDAIGTFMAFGDVFFANKVRVLLASIEVEQGDVKRAYGKFLRLRTYFEDLRDPETVAIIDGNLAECATRLDLGDEALKYATSAAAGFNTFSRAADDVRLRWTRGYQLLREGRYDESLTALLGAHADFVALGMFLVAADVGLDIVWLRLLRGERAEAEELARKLAAEFAAAAMPIHLTHALAALRDSVADGIVTEQQIDSVRRWLNDAEADGSEILTDPLQ